MSLGREKTALQVSSSELAKRDRKRPGNRRKQNGSGSQAGRAEAEAAYPEAGLELLTLIIAQDQSSSDGLKVQ